jgi:hypothetical protein
MSVVYASSLSNIVKSATLFNTANNTNTTIGAGNGNTVIPNLALSSATGSDPTLVSSFNNANATFTAPYNGLFTFDLFIVFASPSNTTVYRTYFYTNALGGNFISFKQNDTYGSGQTCNTVTLRMTKGQINQLYAITSVAWGNQYSALNITAIPT